ncbi:NMD protein affecting ribosome stability and mRNA decay [Thermoplasmatales archaeon BRNA1]|nr:NMD protein affecting ribosome stability and mRNA decay [Thermoplasmatales archaeon BRNA1]
MTGFCVECGKEIDRTVHGMCMDCFLRDRELVSLPDHVDQNQCTMCGQFHRHGEWLSMSLDKAVSIAAREALSCIKEGRVTDIRAVIDPLDEYNYQVTLNCTVDIDGYEAEGTASTIVRVKNTVCRICSRRTGNYYEAILQLRTAEKAMPPELQDEALARVERLVDDAAATDANAFITKMEMVPGGVDVYLSLIALGRACVKDLGETYCAETDESSKLVGQTRDGLDMYRVSYLVRLPEFHVGDIVRYQKRYYLLKRVSSAGAKLVSLKDFTNMPVKRQNVTDMKVYAKSDELLDAVVVSRSGGEIQAMDPANYATRDLRVPADAEIGDSVKVVRIDDVLYYVPDL